MRVRTVAGTGTEPNPALNRGCGGEGELGMRWGEGGGGEGGGEVAGGEVTGAGGGGEGDGEGGGGGEGDTQLAIWEPVGEEVVGESWGKEWGAGRACAVKAPHPQAKRTTHHR
ncbi:hypothetical protein CYMTET_7836 [Cymbomonas tetramitiformis]|uniref:Uncharacterized protein n=1 Tax=Cymbomonas tetramitiformis TaxID=36881 RepID=A0AAE0GU91_9CHLO|nr:hypothetical protein CYMTET_7836 [Cymbomonas tetramitiformis]